MKNNNSKALMTIAIHTDGAFGKPFAVASEVIAEKGFVIERFYQYFKDPSITNIWTIDTLLHWLDLKEGIEVTDYDELYTNFYKFYFKYVFHSHIVTHDYTGTRSYHSLIRELYTLKNKETTIDIQAEANGPSSRYNHPVLDLSSLLILTGNQTGNILEYLAKEKIPLEGTGCIYHLPFYLKAIQAAYCCLRNQFYNITFKKE